MRRCRLCPRQIPLLDGNNAGRSCVRFRWRYAPAPIHISCLAQDPFACLDVLRRHIAQRCTDFVRQHNQARVDFRSLLKVGLIASVAFNSARNLRPSPNQPLTLQVQQLFISQRPVILSPHKEEAGQDRCRCCQHGHGLQYPILVFQPSRSFCLLSASLLLNFRHPALFDRQGLGDCNAACNAPNAN